MEGGQPARERERQREKGALFLMEAPTVRWEGEKTDISTTDGQQREHY